MEEVALIGSLAIIATNTLLRPISRMVNRRATSKTPVVDDDPEPTKDYMLEVVTTEKSEARVRALVLQAVTRPEYTLQSLDIRPVKDSRMRVLAGIVAKHAGDVNGLEHAVQRIILDPKVTSGRWWAVEADD
jgi:putative Mg2+ transporter-C (MgtC) family protein